jgi:hypothetical protein
MRAVNVPFVTASSDARTHDMGRGCIRVSTKLASTWPLVISNGGRQKDNPFAHRVQCFSHLLNQFYKCQRNLLL